MKSGWAPFLVAALAFAFTPGCRHTPEHDRDQDKADIEKVFQKYLQSLDGADVALASQVWRQSPDLLVVTPVGRFQGWESVKNDIYSAMQKQFRERHAVASNVSIVVAGDAAWLVYDFEFTATRADGEPLTLKGWESHGYLRTVDGWRIAQLHYSVPPPPPPPPPS